MTDFFPAGGVSGDRRSDANMMTRSDEGQPWQAIKSGRKRAAKRRGGSQKGSADPLEALNRLAEAKAVASKENTRAQSQVEEIFSRRQHLFEVESRFVRRRDHFLAAGEADPSQSSHAAELAATAERLRKDVERLLISLEAPKELALVRARRTSSALTRIVEASLRLDKAMKALDLLKVEEANRERLKALEQASYSRLAGLGGAARSRPAVSEAEATSQLEADFRVREVTRLAHEAEALAELQKERLS